MSKFPTNAFSHLPQLEILVWSLISTCLLSSMLSASEKYAFPIFVTFQRLKTAFEIWHWNSCTCSYNLKIRQLQFLTIRTSKVPYGLPPKCSEFRCSMSDKKDEIPAHHSNPQAAALAACLQTHWVQDTVNHITYDILQPYLPSRTLRSATKNLFKL